MALRDSADSHQVAPEARSGRFREVPTAGEQLETRVLLRHIDEPGLHRIETYEQLGGYTALKRAFRDCEPGELVSEFEASGLRGRGGAGFSMGKKIGRAHV